METFALGKPLSVGRMPALGTAGAQPGVQHAVGAIRLAGSRVTALW